MKTITRTSRAILIFGLSSLLCFYPSVGLVQTTPGALDQSFGNGGKVVTDLGGFDEVHAMAVQNDGKIIAAGTTAVDFGLARYNPDGSLDMGFGVGGKVTTDIYPTILFERVNAIALQPDGKIVVAGYAGGGGTINWDFALVRYDVDGSLDKSFGKGGKVTTEFQSFNSTEYGFALAIQSDGKIIVGGTCSSPSLLDQVFGVVRYNLDGSLDPTFGNGGKTTITFVNNSDYAEIINSLALQPDGKIVAAGFAANDFGMVRLNPNGTLDTSFGAGGKVRTDFDPVTDVDVDIDGALAISLQPDGHILLAGRSIRSPGNEGLSLARYNPDGTLDTGFGNGGKLMADFFPTGSGLLGDGLNCIIFQNDGKIIAGGLSDARTRSDFGITRYNQDGTLDLTFGLGGKVITDFGTSRFGGSREAVYALALQPDGKIIAAGEDGSGDFALARYDVPVPADFELGFNATQLTAQRGTTLRIVVNVNRRGGFSGNVTVTPPDTSAIKVKMKPPNPLSTIESSVTFKAKIKPGAETGSHKLTFAAMDSAGRSRTASLTLLIQ